jgi:hypothetical protein
VRVGVDVGGAFPGVTAFPSGTIGIVKDILAAGIKPRCNFEDCTRADIYGFCIPFALDVRSGYDYRDSERPLSR